MNFYTNSFIFKLLSFLIRPLISSEIRKEDLAKINPDKKLIYALASESAIDLAALNEICRQNNLPLPIDTIKFTNSKQFICLKNPKYLISEQKFKRQKTHNLEEVLKIDDDIFIIPVSISWGNRPDKKQSLFKIIFSPSWRPAGSIKRIFKLIAHGRNLKIQFERPFNINEEIEQKNSTEKNALILSRYLRAVFRKSKQAMLGPDISHRRTLVKSLVKNKYVRDEIKQLANGNKSRKKQLTKKAHRYANEICSDLHYPTVSLLASGFTWFWNTRYEGLHTKNLEEIRELSKENSLIFLPCHRSHIDYCALTYLLYENGLMVPQVAAGNNLNLPVIGGILRGAGAVFMRRTFMSNTLYSTVFFEHIRALMTRGNSIEFFPEGGRSRTGLSLPSRPGLLSLIIRSFASLKNQNVKIVPVYIGYEKILEGQSYLSELAGGKKKKESIFDPLKVFKDFRNYLGNAYLNFSDPIDLDSFLSEQVKDDYSLTSPQEKPLWLQEVTSRLGQEVIRSINNSVAVTSTSLFSVALLTSTTQAMSEEDLAERMKFFLGLIEDSSEYKDVWITQKEVKEMITKTEKLGFINPTLIASKKIYRPTSDQVATLSFYKNNIAHLYILYSLICESVKFVKSAPKEEVINLIEMIYPIFAKDFHLKNKIINQEDISQTIEILKNKSLLDEDEKGNILSPDENSSYFQNYIALSHLCEPSLKRFYIVMHTMWQSGSIQKDDLNTRCKELAENLEEIEGWPYPEFSDKAKFDNFVYMMKETKFFKEDESGYLSASKITKRANKLYEQFFDKEFLEFIGTQTS
jgi:glycerol-3-phosphate O-acyltransferase